MERGAELSPLLLLRARRRGRGRGWQERSGAALVGLHGLRQLSPRCRRGVLSRKASLAGGDKGWGASRRRPAPAAAGLMLRRRRWWCEVAGCCWVGLGVGAAAVLRSVSVSMLLYLSLTRPSLLPHLMAAVSFHRFFFSVILFFFSFSFWFC